MPRKSEFIWRGFNPENKNGTPHENRLCYIYSDAIPVEDAVIASYCDGEWVQYGDDWPLHEALTGLHFCYLPLPPPKK